MEGRNEKKDTVTNLRERERKKKKRKGEKERERQRERERERETDWWQRETEREIKTRKNGNENVIPSFNTTVVKFIAVQRRLEAIG